MKKLKSMILIIFVVCTMSCSKQDLINDSYDCGCTDEFIVTEVSETGSQTIEVLPIRVCEIFYIETVVDNYEQTQKNLYSGIKWNTDLKKLSKKQGCQK